MPKTKSWAMVLVGLVCCWNLSATAEDENIFKFALSADYYGKYIWRGQNMNDGSVFQPSVSVGAYGLTASIWGNLDLTNSNANDGEFTEFDYTLDYSGAIPGTGCVKFSVGAIHYRFPNTRFNPTREVYGALSLNAPLSAYVKLFYDVDEIEGGYVQFGVGHTIEKIVTFAENCHCGLQAGANIGYGTSSYNQGYFGVDEGRFNDFTVSAALPIYIGRWTIKPSVGYSTMLTDGVRAATDKSDNLWGGVSASVSF